MDFRLIKILSFLILINSNIFAIQYDSLFIDSTKIFFNNELGVKLNPDLFTKWSPNKEPRKMLFISYQHRVETPKKIEIYKESEYYENLGFVTYESIVIADASAFLNKKLVSYSYESLSLIIFHELSHNYFLQENIILPPNISEAACELIGNYCLLNYSKYNKKVNKINANKMVKLNEITFEIFNKYISKINKESEDVEDLCDKCNNELFLLSKDYCDSQIDRFYQSVNTAFLLKSINYCENYFLLKKVFLKAKTIMKFTEILRNSTLHDQGCKIYLENYIK